MNKLFGIPMTNIMIALLVILALVMLVTVYIAVRNPHIFKLGVRNVPRRKAQTGLIVIGLMLSTLIMSAAFTTGDSISYSVGDAVYKSLGRVDEVIEPRQDPNNTLRSADRIPASALTDLETRFKGDPDMTGFVPALNENVPALNPRTSLSEPIASLAGVDARHVDAIGGILDKNGDRLDIGALKPGEALINETGAEKLGARVGDAIESYYNNQPVSFKVVGIARDAVYNGGGSGSNGAIMPGLLIPLDRAQALFNQENTYQTIYVANTGDVRSGVTRSDVVAQKLEPVLAPQDLEVEKSKQDSVRAAELRGNLFTTFFIVLGLFAIAAGVLLIFLIFTMLAAERRSEMGMSRAVGMHRRHLVQMFLAEGTAYDLLSAAIGAAAGVGLALGIVFAIKALVGDQVPISPYVRPRSLIVAYCLGVVLTFGTIAFSSWRVSRLNIVAAIRDTEEPVRRKAGRRSLIWGLIMVVGGMLAAVSGLSAARAFPFYLGAMLVMFGLGLILRRFGVPERVVFTAVGLTVLAWWGVPFSVHDKLWGELSGGIEMFFVSGVGLITGAVLLIVFNADLLLRFVQWLGRPFGRFAPALKTGVAYPLANRGRTGMTLAMFGLVIFSLVVTSTMNASFTRALTSDDTLGGYDVVAAVNSNNPVDDFKGAVQQAGKVDTNDWTGLGTSRLVRPTDTQVRRAGSPDFKQYTVRGVDTGFLESNRFKIQTRSPGYASGHEVWEAIGKDPGLAVVDARVIPGTGGFGPPPDKTAFTLNGIESTDTAMQPVKVEVRDRKTGRTQQVTIIGIIDQTMNIGDGQSREAGGLFMNDKSFQRVFSEDQQLTSYFVSLRDAGQSKAVADGIEAPLVRNGVQAQDRRGELRDGQAQTLAFTYILQGFLALGLVVGVAALGVIALRSVVERRQQIGMLRALGYRKGMVSTSFLIEAMFIAVTGAVIGVSTGLVLARNLLASGNTGDNITELVIPFGRIALVIGMTLVAAYAMTVIPARRASRVPIAEALRYE